MSSEAKDKALEELKKKYVEQKEAEQKALEAESKAQSILKRLLTEEARQRLNNVKLVNRELYAKAFQAVMALVQQGYVREKLSDEQLKQVLMQLKNDREISIKRK